MELRDQLFKDWILDKRDNLKYNEEKGRKIFYSFKEVYGRDVVNSYL